MGGRVRETDFVDALLGVDSNSPAAPDETKRIRYLNCTACSVNIGPGYVRDEVWLSPDKPIVLADVELKALTPICRSCGRNLEAQGATLALTVDELLSSGGGARMTQLITLRRQQIHGQHSRSRKKTR